MARTKVFDEEVALDRARDVFWTKGYCATSLEDLVSELGISRSSLYDTYTDKHTLYVAALERYKHQTLDQIVATLMKSYPVLPAIEALLENVVNASGWEASAQSNSSANKGCFIVNSMIEFSGNDADVAAVIEDNNGRFITALEAALERGQKAGEVTDKSSPRALAAFVFNTIIGLRVMAKARPTRAQLRGIADVALSCLPAR
jgi:TetR/AcrR family transcriptional repressor of nem operon